MNLWERLSILAQSQKPRLPKISPDLWARTLEAHQRLDRLEVRVGELHEIIKGLTSVVDKLRMQMEVVHAHETRRRNG